MQDYDKLTSICIFFKKKLHELITYIERVKFKVRLNGIYIIIVQIDVNKGKK